ncbi:MAG: ComEC/Rec2 family competence protein [Candidatus Saccharimonadales bacterium]
MVLYRRFEFRRTTLMSVGFSALMAGIYVAQFGIQPEWFWLLVLPLVLFVPKRRFISLLAVLVVSFIVGMWRGGTMFNQVDQYKKLYNTSVTVVARVADDAGENQRGQLEFMVDSIVLDKNRLPGKLQVSTYQDVVVYRGDRVSVSAQLRSAKGTSRQGYLSAAKVEVLEKNTSWLESFRSRFFAATNGVLGQPYGVLGLGYLVGLRANIPQLLSDQLAMTGLTHIIAVSGYNLTIIVQAVRKLLGKRSAYQSVMITGLLLAGFIAVAGGSPSINRAAVVCCLSLLAWYFGRRFQPSVLLLLSGALTGFANPLYVWGDPGWYLSFLAFTGVLLLAPLINEMFFHDKPPPMLVGILIETLSAQLLTLPYVLFLFGEVSVIAPLANILVLPLIPLIMLGVFATGCLALLAPSCAAVMALFPQSLLALQLWIIEHLSQLSFAKIAISLSVIRMILAFALILLGIRMLQVVVKRREKSSLTEANHLVQ